MVENRIKQILAERGEVEFSLYSLDYKIVQEENKVLIYPILYDQKKSYYDNIEELLRGYKVYNDSLIDNGNKIHLKK